MFYGYYLEGYKEGTNVSVVGVAACEFISEFVSEAMVVAAKGKNVWTLL